MGPPVDICMIVHNDVAHDSRVLKEAASLAAHGWWVVVLGVCLGAENLPEREAVSGFTILRVTPRLFRDLLPGRMGQLLPLVPVFPLLSLRLRQINARVYHAHDFTGLLQVALAGIWRRPVVYDSHELFFDRPLPDVPAPVRWAIDRLRPLEKLLARRAAGVITVCDSIADRLAATLGILRPTVVRNAVDTRALGPTAAVFRTNGRRAIVHSGGLIGGRHLPELVASLAHLPQDIMLVLMGKGPLQPQLTDQARRLGVADRLLMIPPVPPASVAPTLSQADAAAVLIASQGDSYHHALPNKFFEAVAAGLPLVASPIPEVAGLVRRYDLGVICDPTNPAEIAQAIRTILEPGNLAHYRANVCRAREELNWEVEEGRLIAFYEAIFRDSGA